MCQVSSSLKRGWLLRSDTDRATLLPYGLWVREQGSLDRRPADCRPKADLSLKLKATLCNSGLPYIIHGGQWKVQVGRSSEGFRLPRFQTSTQVQILTTAFSLDYHGCVEKELAHLHGAQSRCWYPFSASLGPLDTGILTWNLVHDYWMKTELGGGDMADLTPEQGAKASLDMIFKPGQQLNGRYPKVLVKGWEKAGGNNQYDGTNSPW